MLGRNIERSGLFPCAVFLQIQRKVKIASRSLTIWKGSAYRTPKKALQKRLITLRITSNYFNFTGTSLNKIKVKCLPP